MEIVDRNRDGRKDGLEIFYILKRGEKNIELSQDAISQLEAYLYEDRPEEALMTFWQIGELREVVFSESNIYLPFRRGFAYNIYMDRIVPAILKLKIVFKEGGEIEANLKERLSFLSY
jgi:hypothetical protein